MRDVTLLPARQHPELLAEPTYQMLLDLPDIEAEVFEIDPTLADTQACCERYKIGADISANCVVVEGKRADQLWYCACMILATTRADVNKTVRNFLGARKASFAPMETALALSGMEYGGINPIGLPTDWPILIDSRVVAAGSVIIGSGLRKSKIWIAGSAVASLPNAQVIEGLALA